MHLPKCSGRVGLSALTLLPLWGRLTLKRDGVMEIDDHLREYWLLDDVEIMLPVSCEMIRDFEQSQKASLPPDFVRYLKFANGFNQFGEYQDRNGFNFWPIDKICRVSNYDDGRFKFESSDEYYIFCDYLDFSWGYAIRTDRNGLGSVVLVGSRDGAPERVARSFPDFIRLYLRNDPRIYPRS